MKKLLSILLVFTLLAGTVGASSLSASAATSTSKSVSYTVNSSNGINVRKDAGTKYSVVGTVNNKISFTVTKTKGDWGYTTDIKATTGKKIKGWVCLTYCKKKTVSNTTTNTNSTTNTTTSKQKYEVTADILNVRKSAGTKYAVVGQVKEGALITLQKTSENWGYSTDIVATNGKKIKGWVSLDYLEKYKAPTATVKNPKLSFKFSSTTTKYTTASSTSLKIGSTSVKVGSTFYTYSANGKKKTTKTPDGYTYAKVGSKYVDLRGWQCLAYTRYCQQLLYGCHEFTSNKFVNLAGASGKATATNIKKWVTKAGVGAHIRSTKPHSFFVIGIDSKGFYYTDANAAKSPNQIKVGYYTWSGFASSPFKNLAFIKYYKA